MVVETILEHPSNYELEKEGKAFLVYAYILSPQVSTTMFFLVFEKGSQGQNISLN